MLSSLEEQGKSAFKLPHFPRLLDMKAKGGGVTSFTRTQPNPISLENFTGFHLGISSNMKSRGIGLETSILFAKEGANVLISDISAPALEKALAKVKEVVPSAYKVETKVR